MKLERISTYRLQLTENETESLSNTVDILHKLYSQMYTNDASFTGFTLQEVVSTYETLDQIIDEGGVWDWWILAYTNF